MIRYLFIISFLFLILDSKGQAIDYENYQKGLLYHKKGEYQKAIVEFSKFISAYPEKTTEVYKLRGYAYLFLKKKTEALKDFEMMSVLDPEETEAYFAQGKTYYQLGNYKEAILKFDKAINIDPFHALSFNDRGMAKCRISNFDSAIKDFIKATVIDTTFAMAYNNAGAARYYNQDIENPVKKDIRDAVKYFDKAIIYDPTLSIAYRNRGAMNLFLGNLDASLKDLTIASKLQPKVAVIPFYKAIVLSSKKSHVSALKNLEKSIELDPSFYFAFEEKGDVLKKMKRYDESIDAYEKAISISNNTTYHGLMKYKISVVYALKKDKLRLYSYLKTAKKLGAFKDRAVYKKFQREKAFHKYRREKKFRKFTKAITKLKKEDKFAQSELRWFRMHD